MEKDDRLSREIEALRGVYRNKGIDLAEDEATVLTRQLGKKLARSAFLCAIVIIVLLAFLIVRFVL